VSFVEVVQRTLELFPVMVPLVLESDPPLALQRKSKVPVGSADSAEQVKVTESPAVIEYLSAMRLFIRGLEVVSIFKVPETVASVSLTVTPTVEVPAVGGAVHETFWPELLESVPVSVVHA
jgi:hypothetical protein